MEITPVPRQRVTREQLELWRTFDRAHAHVVRQIEADLVELHRLPLAWYEVLARLAEAEGRRLRMSELADMVMLSPSGLTRLVDRMVREGLVRRVPAEKDGRGFYAALAEAGNKRLREASETHRRGIRDHVIDQFDDEELAWFGEYLRRIEGRTEVGEE